MPNLTSPCYKPTCNTQLSNALATSNFMFKMYENPGDMCFHAVPIHMTTTWPSEYTNLLVSFRRISGSWKVRASIWDKPVTPATSRMAFRRLWVSDSILRSSWGSAKSKSGTIAASGAMWMGLGGCSSSSLSFSVDFLSLDLAALRFSVFWVLSIPCWTSSLNLPYTLALFLSQTSGLHPAVGTMNTQSAMLSVGKSREGHYLEATVPAVRAWEWITAFSVCCIRGRILPAICLFASCTDRYCVYLHS